MTSPSLDPAFPSGRRPAVEAEVLDILQDAKLNEAGKASEMMSIIERERLKATIESLETVIDNRISQLREPTYSVSTYDVNDDPGKDGEWMEFKANVGQWELRNVLKELYSAGYSRMSVLVQREGPDE